MSGTSRGSHSQPAPMAGVTFASQILLEQMLRERIEMMALQGAKKAPGKMVNKQPAGKIPKST